MNEILQMGGVKAKLRTEYGSCWVWPVSCGWDRERLT